MNGFRSPWPKAFLVVSTLILAAPKIVAAASCPASSIDISASPYNGTYNLTADYDRGSTNSACFTFTGAGVVDLMGYDITATNGAIAISCSGSPILVRDSGNPNKGEITGTWTDAAIKNCSSVEGVRIIGGDAEAGILVITPHVESIKDNVVEAAGVGIAVSWLKNRQSRVIDNIVRAAGTGIEVNFMHDTSGSGSALIEGNLVSGALLYGIYDAAVNTDVVDNLLTGLHEDATAVFNFYGASTGNYCDPCPGGTSCDVSECDYDSALADEWDFPVDVNGVCPGAVTGNLTLSADLDLNSASGACITVNADFLTIDLAGYLITNSKDGGTGISCAGTGQTILVQNTGGLGGIRGRTDNGGFATGIAGCRTISGVRIQDVGTGVSNVSSATYGLDNLTGSMIDADNVGVEAKMVARTSNISGNRIRSGHKGVRIASVENTSTGKVDISDNIFRECHEYAVKVDANHSYVDVHDDIMYRRDPSAISPTASTCLDIGGATSSDVLCDCPEDCPDTVHPPIVYPF